eukprot:gene11123-18630_t
MQAWWLKTSASVKQQIPTFAGYLIKGPSSHPHGWGGTGQPGPQKYGRNQSEGANMLAAALAPVGGTVLWRAFEY